MTTAPQAATAVSVPPMASPETEIVTSWKVSCCGDEARRLGHPRVWLALSRETGMAVCNYCEKRFVIDRDHAHDGH